MREAIDEAYNADSSDLRYRDSGEIREHQDIRNVKGGAVIISCRDHGYGIPDHESEKVFKAYEQLKVSADKDRKYGTVEGKKGAVAGQSSGSGLGLNLVVKFLARMHGHIWYKNCESGGGVEFSFCLPSCDEATSNRTKSPVKAPSPGVVDQPKLLPEMAQRFRILVVDDSMINVKVLVRMLNRLGITHVDKAYSGAMALNTLDDISKERGPSDLPNVIVSDLQMPNMMGYELAKIIRDLDLPTNPVIMACTADWTGGVEEKCLLAGFDGVLRKPITINDLEEFLVGLATKEPK